MAAFPSSTPASSVAATTLAGNNATTAGLPNSNGFDRLTYLEGIVGNLLSGSPPAQTTGQAANAKFTLNATSGATTAAAGDLTGAAIVSAGYSGVGAAALTTRTAAQMVADATLQAGSTWLLIITNTSGGTTTLTAGTGVTLTGTMTMATNTVRIFLVTVVSATAITFQSIAVGTIS